MARLRSARLTDDTLVSQIDDFLGELESDLAEIFGFTPDSNITATAFGFDNSGRLTKDLIVWKTAAGIASFPSAGSVALQITNSTNSKISPIGLMGLAITDNLTYDVLPCFVLGGNLEQAGSGSEYASRDESLPGLAFEIPGFSLWGALFSSTAQGLVPKGSGNSSEFLCTDGVFRNPNATVSEGVKLYSPVSAAGHSYDYVGGEIPPWQGEQFDQNALHAANDDEIILQTAGRYLVGAQISFFPTLPAAGTITVTLYRERASVLTPWSVLSVDFDDVYGESSLSVDTLIDGAVGDRLSVAVEYDDGASGTYAIPVGAEYAHFYAARVQ